MKKRNISRIIAFAAAVMLLLSGCTQSQRNYQIAEAIGTAGMYENNEPVETPQMMERRLQLEESESEEASLMEVLDRAEKLAAGYNFEDAISVLNTIDGLASRDERVSEARERYEQGDTSLVNWADGPIPHLCFPTLIYDTAMAFDGDEKASGYATSMITCKEFREILESLYRNDYILIDIHSAAAMKTDDRGTTSMEELTLKLPQGKKPIILSQDNPDYADVRNGDGIATKLVLDEAGKVKAQYTDAEGHDVVGDYDLIPILESFIEEHPDFSFKGARGIVSVSGTNGVFGYTLPGKDREALDAMAAANGTAEGSDEDASAGLAGVGSGSSAEDFTDDQGKIVQIAKALKESGWDIASAGWSHSYMNDMTLDQFREEMNKWLENTGVLVGNADILFYPFGAEVDYPGEKLDYLLDHDFVYLCGLWGDTDFREVTDLYMRMTRRFIDGYTLVNAPHYFTSFFNAEEIIDSDR